MGRRNWLRALGLVGAACALVGGSGCSHYADDSKTLATYWTLGNYEAAANFSHAKVQESGKTDRVIWLLEEGTAWRAAGQLEQSQQVLEQARLAMQAYAEGPEISLTDEAGALITNLASLPYTGTAYDRIMVSVYKALNAMQLNHLDEARVEFNRALAQQREAVHKNAERLEKAKKEADQKNAAMAHDQKEALSTLYIQQPGLEAYANYVNPFATFLEGLFFMYYGGDGSDLERARFSLQRAHDMVPSNPYVVEDLTAIRSLIDGKGRHPVVHVIVENGMAPLREEIRLDLPLFIVSKDVPYVGVNFPSLAYRQVDSHRYQVATTDHLVYTELLASMDNIVAREFNQELPLIITKTIAAAATKAAAQYALREATKNSGLAGTLVQIGGILYQAAANQADLRTWASLPKEFLYARIPTPQNGVLQISPAGMAAAVRAVEVKPGTTNIVYLRSASSYAPAHISVIQLP